MGSIAKQTSFGLEKLRSPNNWVLRYTVIFSCAFAILENSAVMDKSNIFHANNIHAAIKKTITI